MLAAAVAAARRLRIPWVWLPLVLAWPPFAESIFGANVQTLLFAAFVFLFYRAGGPPWGAPVRDISDPAEPGPLVGGWRRSSARSRSRSHIHGSTCSATGHAPRSAARS